MGSAGLAGFAGLERRGEMLNRQTERDLFQFVHEFGAFGIGFGRSIPLAELADLLGAGTAAANFATTARCAHKLGQPLL